MSLRGDEVRFSTFLQTGPMQRAEPELKQRARDQNS